MLEQNPVAWICWSSIFQTSYHGVIIRNFAGHSQRFFRLICAKGNFMLQISKKLETALVRWKKTRKNWFLVFFLQSTWRFFCYSAWLVLELVAQAWMTRFLELIYEIVPRSLHMSICQVVMIHSISCLSVVKAHLSFKGDYDRNLVIRSIYYGVNQDKWRWNWQLRFTYREINFGIESRRDGHPKFNYYLPRS